MPGGPTAFSRAPVAAVGRGIRNRAAPRERRPPGAGKSGLPGERLSRTFLGPAPVGAGRGEAISAVRSRAAPRERRPPGAGKPGLPRERLLRTSPGAGAGGRRPRGGDQRGPKQSGAAGAASSRSRETGAARGAVVARFHRGRCWRAPAAGRRSAQSEAERRRRSGALQESGNRGCHGLHWPPSAANIVSTGTA